MTFWDALLADLPKVAIWYAVALLLALATLPGRARWRRR